VSGAYRSQELVKLKIEDIEEIKLGLLVKIPLALRSKIFNERRFFIKYQDGVCHRQAVDIHKISSVSQEVAKDLNLENVNEYRGHCLRRISATLVDSSKLCIKNGIF
jgi:hypothetical protein